MVLKCHFIFRDEIYIGIQTRRGPFHPVLVECCTRFPLCLLSADKPCAAYIVCPPACHVTRLGVCCAPALHTLSSVPPPPHPGLGLVAQLSFISLCVLLLSLVNPLALAVVVTECSLCPVILHQCHPLRQSLARQQIQP